MNEHDFLKRMERQYNRVSIDHVSKANEILSRVDELKKTREGRVKCLKYRTIIDLVKMISDNSTQDIKENGIQVGQILRMTERYLA